jgi:hypothetical protein
VTCPLPVPLAPDEIGSHAAVLLADHAHPLGAVMPIDPAPPAAGRDCVGDDSEYEQLIAASVTVNVWPAIASVPVRGFVLVLAEALNATAPGPLPLAPLVIVSHGALLVAVQPHPPRPVTLTDPVPPAAVNAWLAAVRP